MHGPGKYDPECTFARAICGAKGLVLLVHDGSKGHGFSVQLPIEALVALPDTLREVAAQVEADLIAKGMVERKP